MRDPYEVLGVPKGADAKEIKKASSTFEWNDRVIAREILGPAALLY